MYKNLVFITLSLLLVGWTHQVPVAFKPLDGLAFTTNASFRVVEFGGSEILLYQDQTLVGNIQRIRVAVPDQTAIDALRKGFAEAQKGYILPRLLDTSPHIYAYVVETPKLSTVFVATQQETATWALISVKREYFDQLAASLGLSN